MLARALSWTLLSLVTLAAGAAEASGPGEGGDGGVDPVTIDVDPPGATTPAPADPAEAIAITPPEAASLQSDTGGYEYFDETYEPYPPEPYTSEPYEPEPERRTTLRLDSGYFGLGLMPGMTLHHKGFHPNTRMELEFGGTLEHRYRDLALSFGVASHITPYYERKAPGFGADVTLTALLGPVYLRTGLGALGGLPRGHQLHDTTAAVGGVVGLGLSFGRAPMVRIGVDYDLRINTRLEPVHTWFLSLRLVCCRKD